MSIMNPVQVAEPDKKKEKELRMYYDKDLDASGSVHMETNEEKERETPQVKTEHSERLPMEGKQLTETNLESEDEFKDDQYQAIIIKEGTKNAPTDSGKKKEKSKGKKKKSKKEKKAAKAAKQSEEENLADMPDMKTLRSEILERLRPDKQPEVKQEPPKPEVEHVTIAQKAEVKEVEEAPLPKIVKPVIPPKDIIEPSKPSAAPRKSRQISCPAETVDAFAARFGKYVKKSPKTYLGRQYKQFISHQRHISDFCKNVTKPGKNRTTHLANYNESGVRLKKNRPEDGGYIHASFLRLTSDNYILAQGPTRKSACDFYRMIWQNRIGLIVCLDNLTSPNNCIRYFCFNAGESCKVSSRFIVKTVSVCQTDYPPLAIFSLLVRNNDEILDNTRGVRVIRQKDWPFMTLPKSPKIILETMELMRLMGEGWKKKGREHRPVLIHGTYGVGRTGIFAATSLLCKQMWKLEQVTLLKAILAVRRHRYGTINSIDQLAVIIESILEYSVALNLIDSTDRKYQDAIAILRRVWQPSAGIDR